MGLKEAISLLFFLFFLRGCYDFIKNHEANKCQMTYMFEYPEYVNIPLDKGLQKQYKKYGLYVYGEGDYAESLKHGKLNGIPILFIPGNAGSYKQVRSIGSVLLRMADSKQSQVHFNVFAVDFNEEFSALYGGVLNSQTDFVVECIKHILSLYKQNGIHHKQIILYGHSMGGIIARAVFTHSAFNHESVNLVFNLATPNLGPVVAADKFVNEFYEKVNSYWKMNLSSDGGGVDHVTLVSVGGGDRDVLVRSDLTMINRLFIRNDFKYNPITVIAPAVPELWASTDHLCIVWCKQLVLATSRLLFDLNSKAVNSDKAHEIAHYHLIKKTTGSKHFPPETAASLSVFQFQQNGFWRERNDKTWVFFRKMVVKTSHILVPLWKDGEVIMVTAFNIPKDDWIFACRASLLADGRTKVCLQADNLSSKTEILTGHKSMVRRRAQLAVSDLKAQGYTHVMVHCGLTGSKVEAVGERYPANRRHINFQVSSGWDFLFGPQTILYSTAPKATFYNISLVSLHSLWQAYIIKVDSHGCASTCRDTGRGLLQFHVPWANDLRQTPLSCNDSTELLIKLLVPRSFDDRHSSSQLLLHLDFECSYKVSIQVSFNEIMSQIARFYATLLPSYIIANILLAFSFQLSYLAKAGPCPDFLSSVSSCSSLSLLLIPSMLSFLLQPSGILYSLFHLPIPYIDDKYLNEMSLSFIGLRPLLYVISYGAVFSSAWIIGLLVIFCSNILQWIKSSNMMLIGIKDPLTRIRKKWDVSVPTDRQLFKINALPVFIACALIAISYVTCAALALILGFLLLFLKLCNTCCDNRALASRKGDHRFSTRWHLHISILQLWLWMCLLNIPSLIHWFQNLDVHLKLIPDPASTTATIASLSLVAILQFGVPTEHSSSFIVTSRMAYIASLLSTMYCLVSIYRIPLLISTVLLLFFLQQLSTIILKRKILVVKED